jgi:hypothetical protein
MKSRCAGFVHSRRYEQGWKPCALAPAPGDKFCAAHREGFDAAMLSVAAENATAYVQERKIEAGIREHKRAVRKAARRKIILPDEEGSAEPREPRADVYGERIFATARARSGPRGKLGGEAKSAKAPAATQSNTAGRGHA